MVLNCLLDGKRAARFVLYYAITIIKYDFMLPLLVLADLAACSSARMGAYFMDC